MLLGISHETRLSYDDTITESVIEARMAPRSDAHQTLRGFQLLVGPNAPLFEHIDWLGNRVHQFSIAEPHDIVVIQAHSAVETHPKHPDLVTIPDRLGVPVEDHRMLDYLRFDGPVDQAAGLGDLVDKLRLHRVETAADAVSRVTSGIGQQLEYEKGVTHSATSVSDVLAAGHGVCQDFAHVAIAALRKIGIPARYVSGYLHRPRNSELETHAWCEAWLPSAGWIGFDPTHACACGEGHVAIGSGRSYADVPPNRGVYRGNAEETIRVSVKTEEIAEVPKGLLSPRGSQLDIETLRAGDAEHREQIDYQQEQFQQQQQQQQ